MFARDEFPGEMGFDPADADPVNVFVLDGICLFRHYFDSESAFDVLKQYYNNQQYRFEVPREEFEDVQSYLSDLGYHLSVVADSTPFVVVVRKYRDHPENIFKASVVQRSEDNLNFFLLKDRESVETAVADAGTKLEETSLSNPFTSS